MRTSIRRSMDLTIYTPFKFTILQSSIILEKDNREGLIDTWQVN